MWVSLNAFADVGWHDVWQSREFYDGLWPALSFGLRRFLLDKHNGLFFVPLNVPPIDVLRKAI